MPAWLTLIMALIMTSGLFVLFFGAVSGFFGFRKQKASPKMGVIPGDHLGGVGVWTQWDPSIYAAEFYRVSISVASPNHQIQESRYTYTFATSQKAGFYVPLEFPQVFRDFIASAQSGEKALITLSVKAVGENILHKSFKLNKFYFLSQNTGGTIPPGSKRLDLLKADAPAISVLDFEELNARRKQTDAFDSAGKAKIEKAKASAKPVSPATDATQSTQSESQTAAVAKS